MMWPRTDGIGLEVSVPFLPSVTAMSPSSDAHTNEHKKLKALFAPRKASGRIVRTVPVHARCSEGPFTARTDCIHLGSHGLIFGIELVTSISRNIPPAISPSRTQSSARHQSS